MLRRPMEPQVRFKKPANQSMGVNRSLMKKGRGLGGSLLSSSRDWTLLVFWGEVAPSAQARSSKAEQIREPKPIGNSNQVKEYLRDIFITFYTLLKVYLNQVYRPPISGSTIELICIPALIEPSPLWISTRLLEKHARPHDRMARNREARAR